MPVWGAGSRGKPAGGKMEKRRVPSKIKRVKRISRVHVVASSTAGKKPEGKIKDQKEEKAEKTEV